MKISFFAMTGVTVVLLAQQIKASLKRLMIGMRENIKVVSNLEVGDIVFHIDKGQYSEGFHSFEDPAGGKVTSKEEIAPNQWKIILGKETVYSWGYQYALIGERK
jgi:hypothetical protein